MRNIAVLTAAMILASCGGNSIVGSLDTRQNAGPCPVGGAIYDASRIVVTDGGGTNFTNIAYTGEVTGVRVFCRYLDDQPLDAELEIDFALGKGPQATSNQHTYPYFVAVTRRNGKVLAKQYFSVEGDFSSGPVVGKREVVQDIVIPRADDTISGANFEIIVGFELTEDELKFNREGRRFRLDAGN